MRLRDCALTAPVCSTVPPPAANNAPAPFRGGGAYTGWSPPSKEWDQSTSKESDETQVEIVDEWDEEGNLTRTTTTKIIGAHRKVLKTETTVEEIPAEEAKKYRE